MVLAASCVGHVQTHEAVIVNPGHIHAAMVLKFPVPGMGDTVRVYAPQGPELESFISTVNSFNSREENPTSWELDVCAADDFLSALPEAPQGSFVVLSGKNRLKAQEILEAVSKGYNVLSDKPMAIAPADYEILEEAYALASKRGLVIMDLMTERYETLNRISRDIMGREDIFGSPRSIDIDDVHYFFKEMAGSPMKRPQWYYDVAEQGEGIADVTTHFIDLAMWQCFPGMAVKCTDISEIEAVHYPTAITPEQYSMSTGATDFPDCLQGCVKDGLLQVYSNGILSFKMKGVSVKIRMTWDFKAADGASDSFKSVCEGSSASLFINQDESTGYRRRLTVECSEEAAGKIAGLLDELYSGARIVPCGDERYWIDASAIPNPGHESHFSMVVSQFISYLDGEVVPSWETENTLVKYCITTTAVSKAAEE